MRKQHEINRRGFCLTAARATVLIALPSTAARGKRRENLGHEIQIDLTLPENEPLTEVGGAQYVQLDGEAKIIVYRKSDTEVTAFSSVCTHAGCTVNLPENSLVICPCHGSRYDTEGNVLQGPAPRDLDSFQARIEGTTIYVQMDDLPVRDTAPDAGHGHGRGARVDGDAVRVPLRTRQGPATIVLYDARGKQVRNVGSITQDRALISLRGLGRGRYVLRVADDAGERAIPLNVSGR